MATIATTTNTTPFQYPGETLLVRAPNANQYVCLVKATTADNYVLYSSTDGGGSWASVATIVRTNVADVGALYADFYGYLYWAYRTNESSQDIVYIRQINTATWTIDAEVSLASAGNGGVAGAYYSGLSVASYYDAAAARRYGAIAVGTNIGATQGVTMCAFFALAGGVLIAANNLISGTRVWLHAGTAGRVGPSLDFEHNGDGYTGTPNAWIAYGRTHLKLVKVPWTGGGWSGSPGETTIYSNVGSPNQISGMWDGSRMMIAVPDPVNTSQVMLFQRDRANSTTTTRRTSNHTTGVVRNATMAYDPNTGNVRVWAVGTSTAVLYQTVWTRASNTWSAWASTTLTPLGTNADNYGAKRSSNGDAKWGLYTAATGSPNTLTYTPISLSYSPDTPTWVSPTSGAAADVAATLPLDWAFTDTDPGDTQSAYAVSRQIGAGALNYWRASDSTWQVAEVQNTSSTTALTLGASWASASDATHTFKVKVWDQSSNASGYSAGLMVVPSTPVNPAITAPTAAQVIGSDHVTCTWTATEQTQYRIQLTRTSGGAVIYDSGWIGDGSSRSVLIPFVMVTGEDNTIKLQTANNEGLASAVQSRQFTTSFTPPMTPTCVVTPIPAAGVVRVAIANPTPGGGAPAVATQDLYRRPVGTSDAGVRVGTGLANAATVNDWRAVGSVSYEYRVLTVGVTGVSVFGAWTS